VEKIAINERSFQEYLLKDTWKCTESFTGGHYWIAKEGQEFICNFCGEIRDMPIPVPDHTFHLGRRKDK